MRLLLDTHTLLWFIWHDPKLGAGTLALLTNPANRLFVSVASCWEIAVKVSTRKLVLTQPFDKFINDAVSANGLTVLPITVHHADEVSRLPLHHRDPFDRMLIAQALAEGVPIVSADVKFDLYGVTRLW